MPAIEITDETFAMLQALAQPLVDTPESVIRRLAEEELARDPRASSRRVDERGAEILELNPNIPDNLAHTRVHFVQLGDEELYQPNWNKLLREMHAIALQKVGTLDMLRRLTSANLKSGKYEQEGFAYVPKGNFSIQGLDSNLAWQNVLRLAKVLSLPVQVEFTWYDKEGAAHPGKRGRLQWVPGKA